MRIEKIDPEFKRLAFQRLMFLIGVILLNRISAGGGIVFLILASVYYAMTRRIGDFMIMYMTIPFLTELDGSLIGTGAMFRYGGRAAIFSSTILILLQCANAKGRYTLPIGGIFGYLACALISSIGGYCPVVSYLKILNFAVFMLGLYFGGRMMSERITELNKMRAGIFALAMFLVFGSILLFLWPSMGYMSAAGLVEQGYTEAEIAAQISSGGLHLYKGVTNHSQTLAAMLVIFLGWLACDMFFIEQRLTDLHLALIVCALPLFIKTRSRTALLGLISTCALLSIYAIPRAKLSMGAKRRIKHILSVGLFLMILCATILQISGGGMMKWIRKGDADNKGVGLVESITSTRMGKVEENLMDFNKNRMLGVGFQVNQDSERHLQMQQGFVISAPVERGVLPLGILAEGGILGAIAFLIFLGIFYSGCIRQRLVSTSTLFTVYLIKNLSEMTFFSPNGGGTQWVILLIGGLVVDICTRTKQMHFECNPYGY